MKELNVISLVMIVIIVSFLNCEKDSVSPSPSPEAFDIVGTWHVSQIGSFSDADSSNSTWIFKADNTYEWFLLIAPIYDINGEGTYTLNGNSLTVNSVVAECYGEQQTTLNLTISNNNNTFSMQDPDGDTWIYNRSL